MLLFQLQPDAVVPDLAITSAAPLSSDEVFELELQVSKSLCADAVAAAKGPRLKPPWRFAATSIATRMGDAVAAPTTATITYPPSVPPSSGRKVAPSSGRIVAPSSGRIAAAAAAAGMVRFADVAEHISVPYADAQSKNHEQLRLVSPGGWGASASASSAHAASAGGGYLLSPGGLSAELASFLEEVNATTAGPGPGTGTGTGPGPGARQQDDDGYDADGHDEIETIKEELSEELSESGSGGETPMEMGLGDSGHGVTLDALVEASATAVAAAVTAPMAKAKRGGTTKRKAKPKAKSKGGRKAQRQTESAIPAGAGASPVRPAPKSPPNGKASKPTKRASGAAGKHGPATSYQPSTPLPVVAFDASGVLPKDHKPARGRGRHIQLQTMTEAQIEAESVARQEKNRLAARECRMRRKNHVSGLEGRIAALQKKEQRSQAVIAKLRATLAEYERAGKAK